jgi:hypothetical protein
MNARIFRDTVHPVVGFTAVRNPGRCPRLVALAEFKRAGNELQFQVEEELRKLEQEAHVRTLECYGYVR